MGTHKDDEIKTMNSMQNLISKHDFSTSVRILNWLLSRIQSDAREKEVAEKKKYAEMYQKTIAPEFEAQRFANQPDLGQLGAGRTLV